MPDYSAHVFVCTNTENAVDKRHCGDKRGAEIRKRFNELLVSHKLLDKVMVTNAGCTSQHRLCDSNQGVVIVYGPDRALGGTWYIATPEDIEEIITEHIVNGRIVERMRNNELAVNLG